MAAALGSAGAHTFSADGGLHGVGDVWQKLAADAVLVVMINTEVGWRVRVLLKWQRLVRAEKVRQQRRRSEIWRSAERQWHARRVAGYAAELQRHEDWTDRSGKRQRGQTYSWSEQQEVMDTSEGTTSGAAAVVARRAQRSSDSNVTGHKRGGAAHAVQQAAGAEDATGEATQQRTHRHDGQLVLTPGALARMRGNG